MRYIDIYGRVRARQTFVCGACKRDATPDIEVRDPAPPPRDYKLDCPWDDCGAHVAIINPTEIGTPHEQLEQHAENEADEAEAAADIEREADVAVAQGEAKPAPINVAPPTAAETAETEPPQQPQQQPPQ